GIFCRPSCPARRPNRENVRFYPSAAAAADDGLRACKRCRPLDRSDDDRVGRITALCELIRSRAGDGEPLTLDVLAEHSGFTPSALRRHFKAVVGQSPRQFVETCRFEKLRDGLRRGEGVTDAIYGAGFASSSRVYEQSDDRLGMPPAQYRSGGEGAEISYLLADSPLGRLLVAATDRGLCFVALGDDDAALLAELHGDFPRASIAPSDGDSELIAEALRQLTAHLEGSLPHLDLPLDVRATAFQAQVWRYLQSIPYGETRTYTDVARALGRPKAARAVGTACGSNPVSLAIPCHRVLRSSGSLAGYRWGLERKQKLIEHERRVASEG
ncbi:MAG: bifunctional DNA-binding transcriptional regulator/O6-methylguanine-DNA methyltransferase Ada, partial [Acidobacteriota bacterium]